MAEHDAADSGGTASSADFAERAGERLLAAHGPARAAVLAELIGEHPDRAAELRALCSELDGLDRLFDAGYPDPGGGAPTHIGGYRVQRRLGEGAFGVVYQCAQERPIVRQVAIKVLRPGAGDPRTLQRFAAERQLLAQLNHPGITQVFDAGELPDGRPFFVMEYVDGSPIHAWCVAHRLPCNERVRLFADVCRAVAHAHARGIVHRDLKPANVLVVSTPDGPVPKVIDFGIAKALGGGSEDEPRTETGRVVGTPGYMSPEQAAGRVAEVDARADVFALGVMLYQLLTDDLPWPRVPSGSDTEPVRPSARVTTEDAATGGAAPRRRLAAEIRGDLDWITLKAIARDREERYPSVAALLSDLERHCRGETVSVGPPSLTYRLRKFVRRRRAAVTAAAAIGLAALGSAIALTWASRISAEGGLADGREVVANLLRRANDPALFGTAHGDDVRRALGAEALACAERLLAKRSDDPVLRRDRCDVLLTIAEVHRLLGDPERARSVAQHAAGIARQLFEAAPDQPARRGLLANALRQEARALMMAGDFSAARGSFGDAVGHFEACNDADPARWRPALATSLAEMAASFPDRERKDAIAVLERAVALFDGVRTDERSREETQSGYASALIDLGTQLLAEQRLVDADAQLDRVAPELATLTHDRLRTTARFHLLRGRIAWARQDKQATLPELEAAANAAEQWAREQPRRNPAHRMLIAALDELGQKTNYLGDFEASSSVFRRAIDAAERMVELFPEDPTARSQLGRRHYNFARMLWDRFRLQPLTEAADHVARALVLSDDTDGPRPQTAVPHWQMLTLRAEIADSRGDAAAAGCWRDVEKAVPLETVASELGRGIQIEAFLGIAGLRLRDGDPAAAAEWLERATAIATAHPVHKKWISEIGWHEAKIAFGHRDAAAIVATADRIVAARPAWLGLRRGADALRLAALCEDDPARAAEHRARARTYYERIVATIDPDVRSHPDDPWFVVPWGAARIRLAEFVADDGDAVAALQLVETALEHLDRARPDAHHDQWDDDAYRAGVALRDRLRP